jgi:hypothetical protein
MKMSIYELSNKNNKHKIGIITLIYSIYFLLAPFEDMLNFGAGTILKYIALILIVIIFLNMIRGTLKINLYSSEIILPIVLIIISWASVLWSLNQNVSFSRNITYTLLPMLFVISSIIKLNTKNINFIKKTIILGGVGVFIYILYNYDAFLTNTYGRFTLNENNDPNNLAAQIVLPFFLVLESSFQSNGWKKIFNYSIVGALLFSIFITGSRGALLSILVGGAYIALYELKSKKKLKVIFSIFLFMLVVYLVSLILPETIALRLFSVDSFMRDFEGSGTRSAIWKNAILYVLPNMNIIGVGSGVAPYEMINYFGKIKAIHNTYLNMIIEFGILAFPVFMLFLFSLFKKIKFKNKFYTGAFLAMLVVIFFLDSFAKKFFWNLLIYLIIYHNSSRSTEVHNAESFNC